MMRKTNKGVTIVEVLVALAIFLVLMVPLVSSLVTSIKTTDSAKVTQSRNEFAQVLMEDVKNAPIDDLRSTALASSYFDGSQDVKVTNGSDGDFDIEGSTFIGTEGKKYSYYIQVHKENHSDTYGIMEDLDPTKVAIMPVTFSNYDSVAIESIITQRINDEMSSRLGDADNGTIFKNDDTNDKDTVSSYRNTTASRYVTVTVKGSKSAGFDVSCKLTYIDNGASKSVDYDFYRQHFDNVPNLYLMYNNGMYNESITSDTISYNLNGVDFSDFADNERINAFVIRTADDYSKVIDHYKLSDGSYDETKLTQLISKLNNMYANRIKENYKDDSEAGYDYGGIIDDTLKNGLGYKIDSNSEKLYKKNATYDRNSKNINIGEVTDTTAHFRVYHNLFNSSGDTLVSADTYLSKEINGHKVLDSLDKAYEEIWNIYSVKIWMQEGEIADISKDDKFITLQGTRGGGEIE